MAQTRKQFVTFTFDQGVKASTYVRKLGPGDLTELVNCRRNSDLGPPEKRHGWDRSVISVFDDVEPPPDPGDEI